MKKGSWNEVNMWLTGSPRREQVSGVYCSEATLKSSARVVSLRCRRSVADCKALCAFSEEAEAERGWEYALKCTTATRTLST